MNEKKAITKRKRKKKKEEDIMTRVVCCLGVGCCDNRCPCIELAHQACLGNTQGLLLHGFVDGGTIVASNRIKLVNTAKATVCEYEGASLEHPFTTRILHCGDSEPSAG